MQIKEDAIFIADAHYNFKREDLKTLLQKILKGEIICSQLFLMGDMFDFITKEISYFKKINKELIELIQEISLKIEVVYLEGNHDFNIKQLFPKAHVYSRQMQPVRVYLDDKSVDLSHGDSFVGIKYELLTKVLRCTIILNILNIIDIFGFISKNVEKKLADKKICYKIDGFEELIKRKIKNYSADILIEGHYHQGKRFTFENQEYINIPSLACGKKYMRYKDKQFNEES